MTWFKNSELLIIIMGFGRMKGHSLHEDVRVILIKVVIIIIKLLTI